MYLVRPAKIGYWTDRNLWLESKLQRINVPQSERISSEFGSIRITPNAKVIVLHETVGVEWVKNPQPIGDVSAHSIVASQVVRGLTQQRQPIEIRPPLTHSRALHSRQADSATHASFAQSMGVLVQDH